MNSIWRDTRLIFGALLFDYTELLMDFLFKYVYAINYGGFYLLFLPSFKVPRH